MTSDELIQVIRRDLPTQIQNALQFRAGNHFASNLKAAREVSDELLAWLEALCRDNSIAGFKDGIYEGTRDDWTDRAFAAEARLDRIREILK